MKKKLFKGTALMLSAAILGGSLANTTSVSAAEINPSTYSLEISYLCARATCLALPCPRARARARAR
ncbi:hypothetical protein AAHB54_14115, partial [Bacillus cereus]